MDITEIPEAFTLPLRLSIISSLIEANKTFKELKQLTQATDGNLSTQLSKLETWNYITSEKVIENKKMKSSYTITNFALKQFEEYVDLLFTILKS